MAGVSDVQVKLKLAGSRQFSQNARKAADDLDTAGGRMSRAVGRVQGSVARVGKAMAAAGAAGLGMAAVFGRQAYNATMDLGKGTLALQRVTGLDTKTASAWVSMASLRGVEAKKLQGAFARLDKQIVAGRSGSKQAREAFMQMGVRMGQLKKLTPEQAIEKVSDAMARIKDPAKRAALATQMFGRGAGLQMLPMLTAGSAGIKKMHGELDKAGATLKDTKSIEDQIKAQRQLKISMLGLKVQAGKTLIPMVTSVIRKLNDAAKWMQDHKAEIVAFFRPIIALGRRLIERFKQLPGPLKKVAVGIAAALAIAFGPFVAAVAGVVVLAGVIMNNWKPISRFFTKLWNEVTNAFHNAVKAVKRALGITGNDVKIFWQGIKAAFSRAIQILKIALLPLAVIFKIAFGPIKAIVRSAINGVLGILRGAGKIIGGIIKVIGGILTGRWGQAWNGVKQIFRGAIGALIGIVKTITAPIRTVISKVVGLFSGLGTSIGHAFKSALNAVIGAINSGLRTVNKVLGPRDLGPLGTSPDLRIPEIPKLQTGGEIIAGGWAIVGERGPEMVRLPGGSTVYDSQQTRAGFARMRGARTEIVIPLTATLDGRVIHQSVVRHERIAAEAA